MNGFVDLHCHMLYGIDDGAVSFEEMQKMLDMAYEDGIRHICLTPHANLRADVDFRQEANQAFEELCLYAEKYPDMQFYQGNELFYSHGLVEGIRSGRFLGLNGTRYVLVEFLPTVSYYDLTYALKDLSGAGYFPILAHAERYSALYKRKKELFNMAKNDGFYLQINGTSLFGKWGFNARRFAWKAIKSGTVVAVASDGHGAEGRTPCLGKAFAAVEKRIGKKAAKQLFYHLPLAILEGQRLSY